MIEITTIIREIFEIFSMLYFANFLFLENRLARRKLIPTVIIVICIIAPLDFFFVIPVMPVLALLVEALALKLASGQKMADIMGNLMFGILMTFIPELIITWICMLAKIGENSLAYFIMIVGAILLLVAAGIITNATEILQPLKGHIGRRRELVVIISVSGMIPLVLLGKYFLWDSLMFWEGYEGTATLVAVYFVIGLYLIKTFLEFTRNRSELEVSSAYSDYLRGVTDELNKREHEYKNQLNAIIGMAESGEENACSDIIAFAEEIIKENAQRKKTGTVISDNSIVAAYILKMSREAEDRGICFDYRIERPFPKYSISSRELLEIVANLVNNAFEAVSDVEPENRNVSLSIESSAIEVANYAGENFNEETMAKAFNTGFSTKGKGRGYGMSNVMAIVEKNDIAFDSYITGDYLDIRLKMR